MPNLTELEREVHVWYLSTGDFRAEELAKFATVLSSEERTRANRFAFEKDRRSYVTAHWLVRKVLSHYLPVAQNQWEFTRGLFGKPSISAPKPTVPFEFNLSHTVGMVACAVTSVGPIGVDVERVRAQEYIDVARRFFAPEEVRQLERLPVPQQRSAFFRFWTLKEAYIKAVGKGLSVDLSRFGFRDVMGDEITIQFAEGDDDPADWQFFRHEPSDEFKIAAGVCCPPGSIVNWRLFATPPPGEATP
ncbi:MAG: 4'-phosphopantetheinyl transferase superfamily protein [Planctomycetaceae bacterium]|nr:4'-phosphopantetheinyl transferase superfamily protein [Planctomycetaceae bacterium]